MFFFNHDFDWVIEIQLSISYVPILFNFLFLGTVESNPQVDEAVCLTISFIKYDLDGPIYYPPFDKVWLFLYGVSLNQSPFMFWLYIFQM